MPRPDETPATDATVDAESDIITSKVHRSSDAKMAKRSLQLSLAKVADNAEIQGRALPTSTDPTYGWSNAIRDAERIVDDDRTLIEWIETLIVASYTKPGRPAELPIRSFLVAAIAYMLRFGAGYSISHLHLAMLELPIRDQQRLGIVRTRHGRPAPFTAAHVRGAHERLARALDAEHGDLPEALRQVRFEARQKLVVRLLAATLPKDAYKGGFAIDGTFIPAFYQPNRKYRRSRVTNAASGEVTMTKIVPDPDEPNAIWVSANTDVTLRPQPITDEEIAAAQAELAKTGDSMRLAYPGLDGDAGWHVRGEKSKWGYNAVTMVRSAPGSPQLLESFILGAGSASEYKSGIRLVEHVAESRAADPEVGAAVEGEPLLGLVTADLRASPTIWCSTKSAELLE